MGWSEEEKTYHRAKKVKLLAGFVPSSNTYIIWHTFLHAQAQTRARPDMNVR